MPLKQPPMYASLLVSLRLVSFCAATGIFPLLCSAQTSMADYTYLTKGLLAVAGQQMSKDPAYEFGAKHWMNTPVPGSAATRNTLVAVMYRSATKEPAGLLFLLERAETGFAKVLGIPLPSSSSEILALARKDFDAATSEWSVQAQTYCWHLAMAFAAEVEAKGPTTVSAVVGDAPFHPIDEQLNSCIGKVSANGSGSEFVHPEYHCWEAALRSWIMELRRVQAQILIKAENKDEFSAPFSAWDAYFNDSVTPESQLSALSGSLYQPSLVEAQIKLVKARLEMLKIYLEIVAGE